MKSFQPDIFITMNKKPFSFSTNSSSWVLLAAACAALLAIPQTARADDRTKANNTTNLDQTGSWTLGVVPGSGDVAVWDDTVTAANTTALGSNLSWQGIRIGGTTRTGLVTINAGNTLTLGNAGIDMSTAPRNLSMYNGITVGASQDWTVGSGRTLYFESSGGNVLSGGAGVELTKKGAGILQTSQTTSTFNGTLIIQEGIWSTYGSGFAAATIVLKNGVEVRNMSTGVSTVSGNSATTTTHIDGNVTLVGTSAGTNNTTSLVFNRAAGTAAVNLRANAEINVSNAPVGPNLTGGRVIFGGVSESGGNFSLTKTGPGILDFANASATPTTYTGGTFINEGTLRLVVYGTLPTGGNVTINGGSTLYLNTYYNQSVGALTLTNGAIVQGPDNPAGTLTATSFVMSNGSVSQILAGANATMTKSTSGTVTLSANNTFTGATAVNAGTLIISGSISNSSAVTVAAGAQLRYNSASARTGGLTLSGNGSASRAVLGGIGSINTAITLDNLGDTLSPGNSPGLQGYGVTQTWASMTYLWEVNNFTGTTAGTDFDRINITGNLNLTGGTGAYQLDITSLTGLNANGNVGNFSEVNRSWTILNTTTGISGFNAANWTLLTTNFTSSPAYGGTFSLAQASNDLVLSYAVPEPSTWALLAVSLTTVMVLRRRRRTS